MAGRKPELTAGAGLGPAGPSQATVVRRLQWCRGPMGEHARALAEVGELRTVMAGLPARRGPSEAVDPWNVRETILGIGRTSAGATGAWARCLELNAGDDGGHAEWGAGVLRGDPGPVQ